MANNLRDILAFSEADKSSKEVFEKDATSVLWSTKNRLNRPERFGKSYEEVILAPNQYSAVGGTEWGKAESGKLTSDEEWYFKKAMQIRKGIDNGTIPDPTGGADHYFNPELADPVYGKLNKKNKVKKGEFYYPETYNSGSHSFRKETLKRDEEEKKPVQKSRKKKNEVTESKAKEKVSFNKAFSSARKSGKDTFTWRGKSYNTKLAK